MGISKDAPNMASPVSRSMAINGDFGNRLLKQTQIQKIRSELADHFFDTPNYLSESEVSVNGIPRRLIISKHKSELTQKDVIAYPGESLGLGDVVECYGAHWLVTQKDPNSEILDQSMIELCNTKIRWQNPDTLDIIERWAIIKNPYSTNIKESQTLTTLNGKYELYVTKDEESILVPPDKRFLIGKAGGKPLAYRLTFPDITTESYDGQGNGIIVWNLVSEETVKDSDNTDLMIADYISPTKSNLDVGNDPTLFKVMIRGENQILVGYYKKYVCDFYDGSGLVTNSSRIKDIEWSIECNDKIKPFVRIEPNGKECIVMTENEDILINSKLVLKCQCKNSDTGSYQLECVVM